MNEPKQIGKIWILILPVVIGMLAGMCVIVFVSAPQDAKQVKQDVKHAPTLESCVADINYGRLRLVCPNHRLILCEPERNR